MQHTVLERFLRYVQIDTQSDASSPTQPSTMKQKDLSRVLVQELHDMGVTDAELDEHGYVYATIPSNVDKKVPTICFCSHVDTAPDVTGKNVKPIVHKNYKGKDIVLPDDENIIIRMAEHRGLDKCIGHDIVTASGTTLLGADNKSGVSAIMSAAHILMHNPDIKHGDVRILFTPDEEIGRGVNAVDMKKLGAKFGYTIDGEEMGSIEDETFSADGAVVKITGVSIHPGYAKGKMEHAMKIAGEILTKIPKKYTPEHTEGRQGFIHPTGMTGKLESAELSFILRDFTDRGLKHKGRLLQKIVDKALAKYPNSSATVEIKEQYRNMGKMINKGRNKRTVTYAMEAMKRAGIKDINKNSIRGGTDGSRLSFMGMPCPNIFAGEHSFHSKYEWASVQEMQKAAETMVHLSAIWAERG